MKTEDWDKRIGIPDNITIDTEKEIMYAKIQSLKTELEEVNIELSVYKAMVGSNEFATAIAKNLKDLPEDIRTIIENELKLLNSKK